ncbi:hypothetical protein ACHAPT_011867 [Fusarium lateritium]
MAPAAIIRASAALARTIMSDTSQFLHFKVEQNLCCKPEEEKDQNRHWEKCFWNADALDDGHCRAGCPQASSSTGFTKLALSSNGGCESGLAAYCCKPTVTRKYDKHSLESYLESKVAEWVQAPTCPADIKRRSIELDSTEASTKVSRADVAPEPSPHALLEEAVYGFITVDDNSHEYANVLDSQLTERWTHVTSKNIDLVYRKSGTVRVMVLDNRKAGTASLLCQLNGWDAFMGKGGTNKTLTCGVSDLPDNLKTDWDSPESDIPIHDGLKARDHELVPRKKGEGKARNIVVSIPDNDHNANNQWVIRSQPYFQGDTLAQENGVDTYYMLKFDPDNCMNTRLVRTRQTNGQSTQDIQAHMREQNLLIVDILDNASRLIREQLEDDNEPVPSNMDLSQQWRNFMNNHYERMSARAQQTALDRIRQIREVWESRLYESFFAPWTGDGGIDEPLEEQYRISDFLFFLDSVETNLETTMTLTDNFWGEDESDSNKGESDSGNDDPVNDPDWDPDVDGIPQQ